MRTLRPLLGIALALGAAACDGGTQYLVRYAPGFTPARSTVAVFGVFQGGRMSPEGWFPLSARVSGALGRPSSSCPVAFGDALKQADGDLYAKLDEDVAENGVADEILAPLAAKTDAELILTFSVHGRVAKAPSVGDDAPMGSRAAPTPGGPSMPGQRSLGEAGGARQRRRGGATTWNGLELSASLYAVKLRRSVGRITLLYAGNNVDEAVTLFADKLAAELPGSTCRDWRWTPAK